MIRVPKDVTLINTNAGLTAGAIYGFSNRVKKGGCLKTSPILQAIKQPLFVFYN